MDSIGTRPGATGDPSVAVVIPWRDGGDPDRRANFAYVHAYYLGLGLEVIVVDDGKTSGHFNRHAAYNAGYAQTSADVVAWVEADTLIPLPQILTAAALAADSLGMVVPFTERHELDQPAAARVLSGDVDPFTLRGATVYAQGSSIGQANVTSRATMDAVGGRWDESFEGWGYDDNAAFLLFERLAGRPRWVEGPGMHLWHLPAYACPSPDAAAATARNAALFQRLQAMTDDELRAHVA